MQPFAGYDMPIQYTSIIEEHQAVRRHCGVFDVSHMGEVLVEGTDAERFVNHIFTNDVREMEAGKVLYGMMCYPDGGTVDDLLVYKLADEGFWLVINAANIDKDVAWIRQNAEGYDVRITNQSDFTAQIAVQGPESERIMEEVLGIPCSELTFYTFKQLDELLVSRTGYTGEDGFEVYGESPLITHLWDLLMEAGVQPCGLGCRDTLRFEVGLPLYGDELSPEISPVMSGLSMFCKLDKPEFIGKEALVKQKTEGTARRIIGIELADRAIPRHGYPVLAEGKEIGEVTTGYHSISADKSVCMALIDSSYAKVGTAVEIQIRKKTFPGVVVKKRFYEKDSIIRRVMSMFVWKVTLVT